MALKIRMSRAGAKKRPYYHIVVADARSPRDGLYIERVGAYNPLLEQENPARTTLKIERLKYWLSVGAQPSDRVHSFLSTAGLLEKKALTSQTKKNQPKQKAQERAQAEKDRQAELAAAAEKERADAAAAAEKSSESESAAESAPDAN